MTVKSLVYNLKAKRWDLYVSSKVAEHGEIEDLFRKHPDARYHGPSWRPK